MKGYSPTFATKNKKELNSQTQTSFIELGVKQSKHEEDCDCEKCINKQK